MKEDWFSRQEIRFTPPQVLWLIPLLPLLRIGSYPPDPTASGYTDAPIGKKAIKTKAPSITAVEIASELSAEHLHKACTFEPQDCKAFRNQGRYVRARIVLCGRKSKAENGKRSTHISKCQLFQGL